MPTARRELTAIVGGVLVIAMLLTWAWLSEREHRALRALPEEERHGLYLRTLENLRGPCDGPRAENLRTYCREQAQLVTQLPDCDTACATLARKHLSQPAK